MDVYGARTRPGSVRSDTHPPVPNRLGARPARAPHSSRARDTAARGRRRRASGIEPLQSLAGSFSAGSSRRAARLRAQVGSSPACARHRLHDVGLHRIRWAGHAVEEAPWKNESGERASRRSTARSPRGGRWRHARSRARTLRAALRSAGGGHGPRPSKGWVASLTDPSRPCDGNLAGAERRSIKRHARPAARGRPSTAGTKGFGPRAPGTGWKRTSGTRIVRGTAVHTVSCLRRPRSLRAHHDRFRTRSRRTPFLRREVEGVRSAPGSIAFRGSAQRRPLAARHLEIASRNTYAPTRAARRLQRRFSNRTVGRCRTSAVA